jgi:hypothetical protein
MQPAELRSRIRSRLYGPRPMRNRFFPPYYFQIADNPGTPPANGRRGG